MNQNIVDRPLSNGTKKVSVNAWAFLYAESIQYCQQRASDAHDLEEKLSNLGYDVGFRMSGLITCRERPGKRDIAVVSILQFITTTCWKSLYGKETNSLQRSTQSECEYFIYENDPIPGTFISIPKDLQGRLNCSSFNAGVIRGLLAANGFPATVRAVTPPADPNAKRTNTTVYVVKFDNSVLAREQQQR